MKKLFLILFLSFSVIYSQDSEPEPWNFVWGFSYTPRPFAIDSFQQKSILTGFQWSGSWRMNNILLNNVKTGGKYDTVNGIVNTQMQLMQQPTWQNRNGYHPGYFGAVMMQYDPTLPLNVTNQGTIMRINDPSNPVFGFMYRKGRILNNTSDVNYSRIILEKDSSFVGTKVLDDIWPQPNFKTRSWDDNKAEGQTDNYLGRKWYLTINLRRLNPSIDNIINDDLVLKLKMPIKKWNGNTSNIKFNKLPYNHQDSTENLDTFAIGSRGNYQKLYDVPPTTSFYITNRMIPINTDAPDITISAEFLTNDSTQNNPRFSKEFSQFLIKEFDLEVEYLGNLDIAIDWIRVESASARILMRGEIDSIADKIPGHQDGRGYKEFYISDSDSGFVTIKGSMGQDSLVWRALIAQKNNIYTIVQTCIDDIKVKSNNWKDANIFRFKFQDTENDSYYWWGALRYCNKFSNGLYLTRDGLQEGDLYYHYTKSPNKWLAVEYGQDDVLMPAPYARNGFQDWRGMGIKYGFVKSGNNVAFPDTLGSQFETKLVSGNWSNLTNDNFYSNQIISDVTQARYERSILHNYYNGKKSNYLFEDKQWWFYNLLYQYSFQVVNGDSMLTQAYKRAKTAEEFRLLNMGALIRGCKGFITDGDQNRMLPYIEAGNMGIGNNEIVTTANFYSDSVGSDFINYLNPSLSTWNAHNYVDINTVPSSLGLHFTKIYLGTKSYRSELLKFNTYVRSLDSILMGLDLQGTWSKGYRTYYNEKYFSQNTIPLINDYIDFSNSQVRTKRLFKKSINDNNLMESYDSSFVDISIFENKEVLPFLEFYIAVQNRRTDPLIYTEDLVSGTIKKSMHYYSSAQFDEFVRLGGNNNYGQFKSNEYWKEQWWKRLGCREIQIPLKYNNVLTSNAYLQIQELGVGTDLDTNWWRSNELTHNIDTSFANGGILKVKLLPGEAKFFRVRVAWENVDFKGNLDFSNQRKIIAYPENTTSQLDTSFVDKMIIHSVYYKPDTTNNNKYAVYYKRSQAYDTTDQYNQIRWAPLEFKLSDSILYSNDINLCSPTLKLKSLNCKYPSIVVRYDSTALPPRPFVYVTYTCESVSTPTQNNDTNKVWIIENVLEINSDPFTTPNGIDDARIIAKANSINNNIDKYGHTTINASYNGNYYAWSDQNLGIVTAWKPPSARCFDFSNHVLNLKAIQYFESNHPSLNTYSRLRHKEDNCSIVWTEKPFGDTQYAYDYSEVYYTRLRIDNNQLVNYNAIDHCDIYTLGTPIKYRKDSIYCLSCLEDVGEPNIFKQHQYPVVYRATESNVERYIAGNYDAMLAVKHDRIYWQGLTHQSVPSIFTAGMDTFDSLNSNNEWLAGCIRPVFSTYINSQTRDLHHPNAAQGGLRKYWDTGSNSYLYSQFQSTWGAMDSKILTLDFMSTTRGNSPSSNDQIWHIPHGYFSLDYDWSNLKGNFENHVNSFKLSRTGKYPNLSAMPIMSNDAYYRFNRRIFNSDDQDPSNIKSSLDFFLKKEVEKEFYAPMYGFVDDKGNYSFYSYFVVTDENGTVTTPNFIFMEKDSLGYKYSKEITSEWFEVNNISEINYISEDNNNSTFDLLIERKSDNKRFEFPRYFSNRKSKSGLEVVNGRGDEYRIILNPKSKDLSFIQQLYIYETLDDPRLKSTKTQSIKLDLATGLTSESYSEFSVYPNPADKELQITLLKGDFQSFNVNIIDNVGRVVIDMEANNTTLVDVSKLTTGMYFVKLTANLNGVETLIGIEKVFIK